MAIVGIAGMYHRGVHYTIKNDTPLPKRIFATILEEGLDHLSGDSMVGKSIRIEIDEISYEAADASARSGPIVSSAGDRGPSYASVEEFFQVEGKASFQGAARIDEEDSDLFVIWIQWLPFSEPGVDLNELRQVQHGGLIRSTNSLGDSLRIVLLHELRHCWQFANGLAQHAQPADEVDADQFAFGIVG